MRMSAPMVCQPCNDQLKPAGCSYLQISSGGLLKRSQLMSLIRTRCRSAPYRLHAIELYIHYCTIKCMLPGLADLL